MMVLRQDPMNLIICGVGGQGNILISSLIASALNKKGYHVTVGDTFGAAQRGGAVFSSVRISTRRSCGPLIPEGKAHLVLGLEPLEALRLLQKYGNPEVICITSTSPIYPVGVMASNLRYPQAEALKKTIKSLSKKAWFVDGTDLAAKLGAPISMNVIMAGALIRLGELPLEKGDIEEEIRNAFSGERRELNLRAFEMGFQSFRSRVERSPFRDLDKMGLS